MPLLLIITLITSVFLGGVYVTKPVPVPQEYHSENSNIYPTPAPTTETVVVEPTPTSKPQVVYKQLEPTPKATTTPTDQDPVIQCKWSKESKCAGQSVNLRKSECEGYVCCQVNNGWNLMSKAECTKAQNNKVADLEVKINESRRLRQKDRDAESETRKAEERKRVDELIAKSRQDFEDYKKLSRETMDQTRKLTEEAKSRFKELGKVDAETEARLKQSAENRKKEFYNMCVGNVNAKYRRDQGAMPEYGRVQQDVYYGRDDRFTSGTRRYNDEIAQCAFLYK